MPVLLTVTSDHRSELGAAASCRFDRVGGTIGRSAANDWVLPDPQRFISGHHARIEYVNGGYALTDTSSNGVFLNGSETPIGKPNQEKLKAGDKLKIGEYLIEVSLVDEPGLLAGGSEDGFDEIDALLAPQQSAAPAPSSAAVGDFDFGDLSAPASPAAAEPLGDIDSLFGSPADVSDDPLANLPSNHGPQSMDAGPAESTDPLAFLDELGGSDNSMGALDGLGEDPLAAPKPVQSPAGSAQDHVSSMDANFQPPRATDEMIPDDWGDDDLLGGGSGDDDLLEASWEPEPVPPQPTPSQPAPAPAVPAANPNQIPDDELSLDDLLGGASSAAPQPPASPVGGGQNPVPPTPPVAPQMPQQAPPPAAPAVQPPVQSQAPSGSGASALQQLGLGGLRIDAESADAVVNTVGGMLNQSMQGLIDLLRARRTIKSQFRMSMTQIATAENNPLKFAVDAEDVMQNFFVTRRPGHLPPEPAIEQAFADMQDHQMAMLAGMQLALRHVAEALSPEVLEGRFDGGESKGRLASRKKGKYWEMYCEYYENHVASDEALQRLFGEEFSRAYDEQVQHLAQMRRSKK